MMNEPENIWGRLSDTAIARIQNFEPSDGYYVAFSGGKDSVVILDLVKKSKVKYDVHYNLTTVDPPELVRFIRTQHPEVHISYPEISMWNLIVKKRMPPTRVVRYCCEYLKERGGSDRLVMTGIRGKESNKRAKRGMVEICRRDPSKRYLHPIIDWSISDVWSYIKFNDLPYCKLYDEGFKRLGCIMCPLQTTKQMIRDGERWPKYKEAYIRAFQRCIDKRNKDGLKVTSDFSKWETGEEMMKWWLNQNESEKNKPNGKEEGFSIFCLLNDEENDQ